MIGCGLESLDDFCGVRCYKLAIQDFHLGTVVAVNETTTCTISSCAVDTARSNAWACATLALGPV